MVVQPDYFLVKAKMIRQIVCPPDLKARHSLHVEGVEYLGKMSRCDDSRRRPSTQTLDDINQARSVWPRPSSMERLIYAGLYVLYIKHEP